MERALSEDDFFRAPLAKYLAGPSLAYWCASPALWGVTVRGLLDRATVEQLTRWIEREHAIDVAPYTSILDGSQVSGLDEAAFALLVPFAAANRERQARRVERILLVPPASGVASPTIAGLGAVLAPAVPLDVVPSDSALYAALNAALAATARTVVPRMREVLSADGRLLDELRVLLRGGRGLGQAAAALSISTRTLQRKLAELGTSFAAELMEVKLAEARRLLDASDAKIAAVAIDAGFSSAAHLSAAFKKRFGITPSEHRARRRRARWRANDHPWRRGE